MQDGDLFIELAGIAGVFVGFGALISVRSGGATDAYEVGFLRVLVSIGLMTVIAALAPVALSRYPLAVHHVWAVSSVLVLIGMLGVWVINIRMPEWTSIREADDGRLPQRAEVATTALWGMCVTGSLVSLIVILLGVAPDLEPALYFSVVVLFLVWSALPLMRLVFRQPTSPGRT